MERIIPNEIMVRIIDKSDKRFNQLCLIYDYTAPYYRVHSINKTIEDEWVGCYSEEQFEVISRKLWLTIFLITSSNSEFDSRKYYENKILLRDEFFEDSLYEYSFLYNCNIFCRIRDFTDDNHTKFKNQFIDPNLNKDGYIKKEIFGVEQKVIIPKRDIEVYYKINDIRIKEFTDGIN